PVTSRLEVVNSAPSVGVPIFITGGVVSRVTDTLAVPGFPAASVAVAVSVCGPSRRGTFGTLKLPSLLTVPAIPLTWTEIAELASSGSCTVPLTVASPDDDELNKVSGAGEIIVTTGGVLSLFWIFTENGAVAMPPTASVTVRAAC